MQNSLIKDQAADDIANIVEDQFSTAKNISEIAKKIRQLRTMRQLSIRALSKLAGISPSFLSQIERGISGASIATLMQISEALGIAITDLFDTSEPSSHRVLRYEDRPAVKLAYGCKKMLLSQRPAQQFEVFVGQFDVGGTAGEKPYAHNNSRELLLVQRGTVEVTLGDETYILEEGDCIEYSTATPHLEKNIGNKPAEVLWIISPPTTKAEALKKYTIPKPV